MSGARKRSVPSWDKKEDAVPQTEMSGKIDSSFSPKRSNSEANDVLMSDDFSNENLPHRGGNRGTGYTSKDRDRDRSRSPHRSRGSHRDRERSPFNDERRESYENDSRASHRVCKDFPAGNCRRGGQCRFLHQDSGRPEYSSGSRFQDERNSADRPRSKNSDGHRKDPSRDEDSRDYHRGGGGGNRNADNDQDYRRQSNQTTKPACRFFLAGNCNRQRCKFSHDVPMSGEDHVVKSSRNVDEKNKSWNGPTWNDLETGGFDDKNQTWDEIGWNQESQPQNTGSTQFPTTLNGTEKSFEMNGGPKLLETSRNDTPSGTLASKEEVPQVTSVPVSMPEKQILANALELLYSLPNSAPSGAPAVPPLEDVKREKLEDKLAENNPKREVENSGKSEKVEEGDEKAMRQFKIVLVEFVKEIMKPTWKEGKMSREVYKTIVKKVVDKVTSSIQGVQIPRTQEKIDQYLAFSKSKITKLVEAYVGRFLKA